MRNIGASADFTSVSPVLPSQPIHGAWFAANACWIAGSSAELLGVKCTNGSPSTAAA